MSPPTRRPDMRIAILALIAALAATPVTAAPLALHRGVGVHEWLNWSPLEPDGLIESGAGPSPVGLVQSGRLNPQTLGRRLGDRVEQGP